MMSSRDLWRFILRVGKFLILLPLVWFVYVCMWGSFVDEKHRKNLIYSEGRGFMNLRLKEADSTKDVQVLIVGSSHVYRGIDPRILAQYGIEAFNLGSSLQSPIQTEYLLEKYLEKMNPAIVIFEVGYKTFSSDGAEGAIDIIIHEDELDLDVLKMVFKVNDISVYNTLAYSVYRKKILGETREEYLMTHHDLDRYVDGGFVERLSDEYEGPSVFESSTKEVNGRQQRAFERCLTYLRERSIKTLLIQTPILYSYYTSIENQDEYHTYFIEQASNGHYFNFSDSGYYHTEDFYDHHHLNQRGVTKFNRHLLQAIRQHLHPLSQAD